MRELIKGEFLIFSLKPGYVVPAVVEFMAPMCGYVKARGQWKGEAENSIVMRLPDKWLTPQEHTDILYRTLNALRLMGEEAVLYIDAERNAILMTTSIILGIIKQRLGKLVVATDQR